MWLHMRQNRQLNTEFYDLVIKFWSFNHLIRVFRQAFPRKIGKKVRGVSATHVYCNITYAYCVCGISALGIAGTHRQLCITHYKYRKAAGKNDYFNRFAHQACAYTYLANFCLKGVFPQAGKWSAISISPYLKYTCLGHLGNQFFQPWSKQLITCGRVNEWIQEGCWCNWT